MMAKCKKKSSRSYYLEEPCDETFEYKAVPEELDAMPAPNSTTSKQPLNQAANESVHPADDLLASNVFSAFNNKNLSDMTIYLSAKGGSIELPAHSFVLAACSVYFQKVLAADFAESKSREFTFDDENPHTYWRVFEFMYTGDYSDEPAKDLPVESKSISALHVLR